MGEAERRRREWRLALASASCAALIGSGAAAQVPPPGSPAAPPTREEINRVPLETQASPPSRLSISGGIERAPCVLDEPRFNGMTLTLKGVGFDNLEKVDPAELAPAFQPYVGRTVSLATICEIRDAAATILRRKGYLAAVEVPPQHLGAGTLHLQVVLARLVAVHVRGETGHAERLIAAYLERLKEERPFNQFEAERSLLLLGDLPGYEIRLALRPAGTGPGEIVGDVTVTRSPVAADLNLQNYGSHAVGRWSGLVRVEANDLLGLGDRAVLGFYNTADLREESVVQAAYEVRPGTSGLVLSGHFTYAWTRPDTGEHDPFRARTLVATGEASLPLVRSQRETLSAAAGLDIIDEKLGFGGDPLTADRLRVLYGRLDFTTVDPASIGGTSGFTLAEPRWRVSGSLSIRKGLSWLGASHDCGAAPLYSRCQDTPSLSRLDGDPQGGLVRLSGSLEYRPAPVLTFALSPQAQYAFDPLLSYEQYSLGNYTIGRGYDPGVIIGDSGVGMQTELRFGRLAPTGPRKLAVQPYTFLDSAWVWTRGRLADASDPQKLFSTGVGIRAAWGNRANVDMLVALPLTSLPGRRDGDVRLLLNLTTRLFH